MAKPNFLAHLRERMDQLEKEYNALSEALQLLSSAGSVRGKKTLLPASKGAAVVPAQSAPVKKAKRGRPAGAKKAAKSASKQVKSVKSGKKGKRSRIPNLSEKIQEMVGKNGRFMTNSQITDRLASLYPGKSRSDLGKYISVILANMKSRKELSVVTVDDKGNKMRSGLWGLPKWFDGSKPKNDFLK